ncbi:MAG: sigma-54 factor interaction domain-containing protein, partial [Deltaproteobacteria bacterium]|nr:sigma-54 factor interaction domain-containing protein [Deltaproteobacteria bacterium]
RMLGEIFATALMRQKNEEALRQAFNEIKQLKDQLEAEWSYMREEIKLEHDFSNVIGQSEALQNVLLQVEQVAATDTTVLILGETGTGKELIARSLHNVSLRRDRPLIKVDCASLPANLIENELFGHEKGAFTGAAEKKIGRLELADGGTVFLDEMGELPLELQSKLLRVLQENA